MPMVTMAELTHYFLIFSFVFSATFLVSPTPFSPSSLTFSPAFLARALNMSSWERVKGAQIGAQVSMTRRIAKLVSARHLLNVASSNLGGSAVRRAP